MNKQIIIFIHGFIFALISFFTIVANTPKLTVVMVVDQLAYDYMIKLKPYFNFAFKDLIYKSINYTNAHHPHGATTTATGHASIGTGTLAKDHGIVLNKWYIPEGRKSRAYEDTTEKAAVFSADDNLQPYGKSANRMMVDSLSDNFMLHTNTETPHKVFSLSYKTRAAIGLSGKLGKAIWFDSEIGQFTSSKAFFDKMPEWLSKFNKKKKINEIKEVKWNLFYPHKSKFYRLKDINLNQENNYKFAGLKFSLISEINNKSKNGGIKADIYGEKSKYENFLRTPLANQILLDLGKKCLDVNFDPDKKERFLLWISLSPLDKLGHMYGPQSIEVTDMLYHLDKQIKEFIKYAGKKAGKKNLLFVLTSDHGIEPIPEVMQANNFKLAKRIQVEPLIKEMNEIAQEKYDLPNLVLGFSTSQFYLDPKVFDKLDNVKQNAILHELQKFLKKQPGVKNIWTYDELKNSTFEPYHIEDFYKQQLYPGRSGHLICLPHPFCVFTTYPTGTSHRSGYNYNTHVPLMIYQYRNLGYKKIDEKVWIPQLAVTLAQILRIPKPSASTFDILPGINVKH